MLSRQKHVTCKDSWEKHVSKPRSRKKCSSPKELTEFSLMNTETHIIGYIFLIDLPKCVPNLCFATSFCPYFPFLLIYSSNSEVGIVLEAT